MFGLGGNEIMLIGLAALLLFGPSQLPKFIKGMGESVKEMKKALKDEPEPVKIEAEKKKEA